MSVFPDVYPEFRSFYSDLFVNAAHDDYLQLLVEMGGLGFIVMLWFSSSFIAGRQEDQQMDARREWRYGARGNSGITGILVHSLFDFTFRFGQCRAFYVLCAIAAMEPRFGLARRRHSHRSEVEAALSGPNVFQEIFTD